MLTFAPHPVNKAAPTSAPPRAADTVVAPAVAHHSLAALSVGPREVRPLDTQVGEQDAYEDEADQVASVVMSGTAGAAPPPPPGDTQPSSVADSVPSAGLASGGSPLPSSVRAFYEERFGTDFSDVRIHHDAYADENCRAIGAHAFSYDHHVHLAADHRVEPSFVLAHELAHVIQQRPEPARARAARAFRRERPRVRGALYWAPKSGGSAMSGTAIQQTVGLAGSNSRVREEVWVPNGNRVTARRDQPQAAFGEVGRADYYMGKPIGVVWVSPRRPAPPCDGGDLGRPFVLDRIPFERPRPRLRDEGPRLEPGGVRKNRASDTIGLGELKPADPLMVEFGLRQLEAYEMGIRFAASQTNCYWAQRNESSRWNPTLRRLTGLRPAANHRFGAPATYDLVIASWHGERRAVIEFDPARIGLRVRGGLYAAHVRDGLYVHMARPEDPRAVLDHFTPDAANSPRNRMLIGGATALQDQVIGQLKKPPTARRARPLRRRTLRRGAKRVRARRIEDPFNRHAWERERRGVVNLWRGRGVRTRGSPSPREQLEFVDKLYEAEDASERAVQQIPGAQPLPPSRRLPRGAAAPHIMTTGERPRRHSFDRLYDWFEVWTMPAMSQLGRLRERFGQLYVNVSLRMAEFKRRLQSRFAARGSPRGRMRNWVTVVLRALWSTAASVAGNIFDRTSSLLVASLAANAQRHFERWLPFDDLEELRAEAERNFPSLPGVQAVRDQVQQVQRSLEARFGGVARWFEERLEPLQQIAETVSDLATVVRWASVAIGCLSVPVFGCAASVLRELAPEIIAQVLTWCPVRTRMAEALVATGLFDRIPPMLAARIADSVEGVLPRSIPRPIFDRSAFQTVAVSREVECDPPPSADMWQAYQDVDLELGGDYMRLLMLSHERFGYHSRDPATPEDAIRMRDAVNASGVTEEELSDYLQAHRRQHSETVVEIEAFLTHVRQDVRGRRIGAGRSRARSGRPTRPLANGEWRILPISLREYTRGSAYSKPMEYRTPNGRYAAGIADIQVMDDLDCDARSVSIQFQRTELYDGEGATVQPVHLHQLEVAYIGNPGVNQTWCAVCPSGTAMCRPGAEASSTP